MTTRHPGQSRTRDPGLPVQALIYDFGGPVLRTPFELMRNVERRLGVRPKTFDWTGPFDPARDPLWQRMQANEISEPNYWAHRAEEAAAATGSPDVRALMAQIYPVDDIAVCIRSEAYDTVRSARAAGLRTAILTNDLALFLDEEWISRLDFLAEVDVMVDCSLTGVLKPDPASYQRVLDLLEVPAEAALFVDDQPRNVHGAQAIGMPTVLFDVTDPAESFRTVNRLLGLTVSNQS